MKETLCLDTNPFYKTFHELHSHAMNSCASDHRQSIQDHTEISYTSKYQQVHSSPNDLPYGFVRSPPRLPAWFLVANKRELWGLLFHPGGENMTNTIHCGGAVRPAWSIKGQSAGFEVRLWVASTGVRTVHSPTFAFGLSITSESAVLFGAMKSELLLRGTLGSAPAHGTSRTARRHLSPGATRPSSLLRT